MGKQPTEPSGAEPEKLDFEAEANKILEEMNGTPPTEPKKEEIVKEKPAEDPSKEDVKKEAEKKVIPQEEELKIPRSRLNKEIEKKNAIQVQYDRLKEKLQKEQEKYEALSDDDKEEQENLKKLGMDTKVSKLEDMLEDTEYEKSQKDLTIKELQDTIAQSETKGLAERISELTKEKDGKDGLPKFNIEELIEFSKEKNFLPKDPIELYNFKYQAEIYAKKYEKSAPEIDKGNKGNFAPAEKKPTFKDGDKDFMDEAQRIIDSVGQTT